jgi:hypothetical protein
MAQPVVCTQCGYHGRAKSITRGSIFIEIILWLCLLIPGLIYSIWRLTTRRDGCAQCGGAVIPENTPRAKRILAGAD